jgi:hypothetical protein
LRAKVSKDYAALCPSLARHPAGCHQLGQYGARWGVCADGVGKSCCAGAVGAMSRYISDPAS